MNENLKNTAIVAPATPFVSKIMKGKKTCYLCNGASLRTSVRDYKYALFLLVHYRYDKEICKIVYAPGGHWLFKGLGNNAEALVNSWKDDIKHQRFLIVSVQ